MEDIYERSLKKASACPAIAQRPVVKTPFEVYFRNIGGMLHRNLYGLLRFIAKLRSRFFLMERSDYGASSCTRIRLCCDILPKLRPLPALPAYGAGQCGHGVARPLREKKTHPQTIP